jgi:hypothetical protein
MSNDIPRTAPIQSATFSNPVNAEIRRAAATGIYDIRGGGAKRGCRISTTCCFSAPRCQPLPAGGLPRDLRTGVTLGTRFAKNPIELDIPITIAGMSFGALSARRRRRWAGARRWPGTSTTTGDGGMTPEERGHSKKLVYQYLPSRYGMNPDDLRKADAIEVVVGQGAKPGGGGMLLGQKISDRVAEMRTCPRGSTSARPAVTRTGPGRTTWRSRSWSCARSPAGKSPIYIKVGATRPYFDVALAVKAGADVVVLDGMQGGTAATQDVFIEHVGIPTLACIRPAVKALQDLGMHREVQLSSRAASAPARTWPRRWRWGPMRSPSARRPWSRWATTTRNGRPSINALGTTAGPMTTGTKARPGRHHHAGPGAAARLDPVEGGGGCATTSRS